MTTSTQPAQIVTKVIRKKEWKGQRVRRIEDPRLLTGGDQFIDNFSPPHLLHAAFVRSPYPHALLKRIHIDSAHRMRGVIGLLTDDQAARMSKPLTTYWMLPGIRGPSRPIIARQRVGYIGEPIEFAMDRISDFCDSLRAR